MRLLLIALLLTNSAFAEITFTNPILAGGYPDPSICRDGDDFYIANSTFEYFPGLPIHHSKDLVNWQLIGHGLHREDQVTGKVNLVDVQSDGGIHAPTLRCNNGKFYLITTNVYVAPEQGAPTEFVNFVLIADNPAGPWSQPLVLDGAPGIDPDIFFDDDGTVWYVGTHSPEKPNFPGEGEIWLQQIDPKKWQLTGERHLLWRGACGGVWAEGPHIYKQDGRYYLMVAEGGTSYNHAVTIAVSDSITGEYQSNPRNPIFTSRHLSYDNWVTSTGHADLFQLADGRWYMVALGIRGDTDRRSNMGRETHLIPAIWEREPFEWQTIKYVWPVIAPKTGQVQRHTALPFAKKPQHRNHYFRDDFNNSTLNLQWNFRRLPLDDIYAIDSQKGILKLYTHANVIAERGRAALMGFRQTESDFEYEASMDFSPKTHDAEAGIIVFQKDDNYLSVTVKKNPLGWQLTAILAAPKQAPKVLRTAPIINYAGTIKLRTTADKNNYFLSYSLDNETYVDFVKTEANHLLSKGYTGAYLGLYATGNGVSNNDYAEFDWVNYRGLER